MKGIILMKISVFIKNMPLIISQLELLKNDKDWFPMMELERMKV